MVMARNMGLTVDLNMARIAVSNTAALVMGHSMAPNKATDRIVTVRGMIKVMGLAAPGKAAPVVAEPDKARAHAGHSRVMGSRGPGQTHRNTSSNQAHTRDKPQNYIDLARTLSSWQSELEARFVPPRIWPFFSPRVGRNQACSLQSKWGNGPTFS
jgi:hypothetical protein